MKKQTNHIFPGGQNALLLSLALSLTCTLNFGSANAQDPCSTDMGHTGTPITLSSNTSYDVSGTPLVYTQWSDYSSTSLLNVYENNTFKAEWGQANEYQFEFGYHYSEAVDPKTKNFALDYSYTKGNNKALYGYIGVHLWTRNPVTECYIIDDWYGDKPYAASLGTKVGEYELDGALYTIYAHWRTNQPSQVGNISLMQVFSLRETSRQCGHINISAHISKWLELFHGQTMNIRCNGTSNIDIPVSLGDIDQVNLYHNSGGTGSNLSSGTVDYTYVKLDDNYKKQISSCSITITGDSKTYNGKKQSPDNIVVKDGDKTLVLNQDYKVETDHDCINVGNYSLSIVGIGGYKGTSYETFKITAKEITVKADDKGKKPGDSDPKLTAKISGLVDGESESLISYSISRIKGESEGKYTITPSGSSKQGNYSVSYEKGTFTIDKNYIPTPVSDIPGNQSGIKVWSFGSAIYIESAPGTKYQIIDLSGRTIKSASTTSTKEEVSLKKTGVYIVIVGNTSYKVSVN